MVVQFPEKVMKKGCEPEITSSKTSAKTTQKISESPEVFITDDNTVNTQESGTVENVDNMIVNDQVNVDAPADVQVLPERRSDRLKKDTALTTMEKLERMAKKRNCEGNPLQNNMFSVLPNDEIATLSSHMGVVIEDTAFDTLDLLRDLEKARMTLYNKNKETTQNPQTETVGDNGDNEDALPIEWLRDETSEAEDLILVESRKKIREKRKKYQTLSC